MCGVVQSRIVGVGQIRPEDLQPRPGCEVREFAVGAGRIDGIDHGRGGVGAGVSGRLRQSQLESKDGAGTGRPALIGGPIKIPVATLNEAASGEFPVRSIETVQRRHHASTMLHIGVKPFA